MIGLNITDSEAQQFFKEIDRDDSSSITFVEFKEFVEKEVFDKNNFME